MQKIVNCLNAGGTLLKWFYEEDITAIDACCTEKFNVRKKVCEKQLDVKLKYVN
jgi:hypothetical protein